jgi:hypothetical protein
MPIVFLTAGDCAKSKADLGLRRHLQGGVDP